jgi:hypothetical protein
MTGGDQKSTVTEGKMRRASVTVINLVKGGLKAEQVLEELCEEDHHSGWAKMNAQDLSLVGCTERMRTRNTTTAAWLRAMRHTGLLV